MSESRQCYILVVAPKEWTVLPNKWRDYMERNLTLLHKENGCTDTRRVWWQPQAGEWLLTHRLYGLLVDEEEHTL